ncbi:MAG: hypothetical protein ACJ0DG_11175 [bacterium]
MNVIIDYKVGNLHNLKNALDFSAVETQLVSAADEVRKADRILLPGVGAFSPAMEQLRKSGMLEALQEKVDGGNSFTGNLCRCAITDGSKRRRRNSCRLGLDSG